MNQKQNEQQRLHNRWDAERQFIAGRLGVTPDDADRLLDALPYSTVPSWFEVKEIIDWFDEFDLLKPVNR